MAIGLMVEARADDRSFQRIAAKAEKQFGDAGRNAGKAFEKGLEAADSRAAEKFAKSYDKVADASGKLRVELQKLEDLKSRGAGDTKMIAQSEAVERARRAESRAVRDAANAYKDLSVTSSKLANATSMVGDALAGTRFGALANDVSILTDKFGSFGLKAGLVTAGIAGIAVGAVAAGKALYDLGSQWDSIADNITLATGKTGAELDSLLDVVGDVGSMTAASLETIGTVVQQLVQQFPNLDTGSESIRIMASNLAFLKENGQDVNIREFGLAMRVFGVSAESGVKALDDFAGASRKTGVPINELISQVRSGAPIFKQFGLDMGAAAAYMGSFESAGIDSASSLQGLRTALAKLTGSGRDAQTVLQETITEIKRLYDTGNSDAARKMAIETFGAKSFAPFLDAIEQGTLDLGKMNEALKQTSMGVQDMQRQVEDGKEGWQKLTNTLKNTFKPAADLVFKAANDGLMLMTGHLTEVQGGFKTAADGAEDLRAKLDEIVNLQRQFQPDSPLGRMLAPAGAPGAPQSVPTAGAGVGLFGDWRNNGGTFGPGGGFYNLPNDSKGSSSSKTNVPYGQYSLDSIPLGSFPGEQQLGLPGRKIEQHTGPGAYEVDPQKVFDAQTGVMSSQQRLESARARILELQAKNDRTAQEEQDAKNNLILAERGYLKSQQDLIDAQQGTWKKAEDATKKFAQGMDEFGTQLDKDFGLSKGLPGLAENLAKFIGSIAAAPLTGPLNAIAAAQGGVGKTGSGLIGMLGAAGALGPGFQDFSGVGMPGMMQPGAVSGGASGASGGTPLVWNPPQAAGQQGFWTPSGSASSAGQALANGGRASVRGYMGDAALLSHLPSGGQYDNVTKDLSKGLIDCASGVEDLVNIIDGKPTAGGSLWTGNASKVLPQMGFLPGVGGPGDFRIGYRNGGPGGGHMQATLPDGTNVNFGSTEAIQAGGRDGSAGAFDPSFTDHYYRPIRPGGPSGPSSGPYAPLTPAQLTDPGLTPGGSIAPPWAPNGTNPGSFFDAYGLPSPLNRDTGGPLPPGISVVQNNTGKPETVVNPQGMAGNQHVSEAFPGPGPGNSGGIGSSAKTGQQGPTEIGGAEPNAQDGSSVGGGGGLFGAAVGAASMAADSFAPGSGAAVQIAGQEIQRAIKAGGQAAGILTEGLMETFLPTGASEIANDNWLTRIAGGFVGLGPQLPNMAGKAPTPVPEQAPTQPMPLPAAPSADAGKGGHGPQNVTLNINGVQNVDESAARMIRDTTANTLQTATLGPGGR